MLVDNSRLELDFQILDLGLHDDAVSLVTALRVVWMLAVVLMFGSIGVCILLAECLVKVVFKFGRIVRIKYFLFLNVDLYLLLDFNIK